MTLNAVFGASKLSITNYPVLVSKFSSFAYENFCYLKYISSRNEVTFVCSIYRKRAGQWASLKNQELEAYFLTILLKKCNENNLILMLNAKHHTFI